MTFILYFSFGLAQCIAKNAAVQTERAIKFTHRKMRQVKVARDLHVRQKSSGTSALPLCTEVQFRLSSVKCSLTRQLKMKDSGS